MFRDCWVNARFNQEKALVGAFSVIVNLRMELFEALLCIHDPVMTVRCDTARSSPAPAAR